MKKIIIEIYVTTLAIFLINTVNVRSHHEVGFNLSWKSLADIRQCVDNAKIAKNGSTLSSTSDILANMDYKLQMHFFDSLFDKVVVASDTKNQPYNKCFIKLCLSEIKKVSLDFTKTWKNIQLIKKKEEKLLYVGNYKFYIDEQDFAWQFHNHIKLHKRREWEIMNFNSFCAALACVGEITRAGFKCSNGDENVKILSNQFFGSLVEEYKDHLRSYEPNKQNAEQFCAERTCLHELWSVGFRRNMSFFAARKFYKDNEDTINDFQYFSYVSTYVGQFLGKSKVDGFDPYDFCALAAVNHIVYNE